ncbi:hypothetical protein SK128_026446 [Halocaridina rubra]|uniref:Lebercilin domain-containing protein n=1 Tax=Halocaridina rubra TaxID=373956 RepID=A0AAN8WM81_HALRR
MPTFLNNLSLITIPPDNFSTVELQDQNRLVVRLCKRQEAALQRYQDMRTELPHIIEAHKIEINVLQEKLRRSTEVNRRNSDKLKMNDGRIMKLTEELSRLRDLSKRRNLPERDQLNKKLSTTNQSLQEREKEVEVGVRQPRSEVLNLGAMKRI